MTMSSRRFIAPIFGAMLILFAMLLANGTAQAQCTSTSVKVTNKAGCDLTLCLYGLSSTKPLCWDIPAGTTTPINFPPGFVPAGGVSAGGNLYPFSTATGCTACYAQRSSSTVLCCAVVCYDPNTCTITITPCLTSICGR